MAEAAVATWIVSKGGADIYWRAEMPAKYLGAKLLIIPEKNSKNYMRPNISNKRGAFRWQMTEEGAYYPDIEGTVVWTRPCMVRATHGAAMSMNGHRVICEVDDNYLSPPGQNIFMKRNNYGALSRRSHMQAFASMDAIICSTKWLRDEYASTFRKELRYVPDMYVARNNVESADPRWQPQPRPWLEGHNGRLRVGIQGSHQHVHDWRLAAPALHLAKEMGCEIVFMGLDPAEHDPTWKDFLGEYTHIPWSDPRLYHQQQIPFDIGLCPLLMNRHTLGKSDIKFLEYTMSGVATVAMNNAVYNRSMKHMETGLLAGSPDEMAICVQDLIRYPKRREELVANARQFVLEERTIEGNISEWADAVHG